MSFDNPETPATTSGEEIVSIPEKVQELNSVKEPFPAPVVVLKPTTFTTKPTNPNPNPNPTFTTLYFEEEEEEEESPNPTLPLATEKKPTEGGTITSAHEDIPSDHEDIPIDAIEESIPSAAIESKTSSAGIVEIVSALASTSAAVKQEMWELDSEQISVSEVDELDQVEEQDGLVHEESGGDPENSFENILEGECEVEHGFDDVFDDAWDQWVQKSNSNGVGAADVADVAASSSSSTKEALLAYQQQTLSSQPDLTDFKTIPDFMKMITDAEIEFDRRAKIIADTEIENDLRYARMLQQEMDQAVAIQTQLEIDEEEAKRIEEEEDAEKKTKKGGRKKKASKKASLSSDDEGPEWLPQHQQLDQLVESNESSDVEIIERRPKKQRKSLTPKKATSSKTRVTTPKKAISALPALTEQQLLSGSLSWSECLERYFVEFHIPTHPQSSTYQALHDAIGKYFESHFADEPLPSSSRASKSRASKNRMIHGGEKEWKGFAEFIRSQLMMDSDDVVSDDEVVEVDHYEIQADEEPPLLIPNTTTTEGERVRESTPEPVVVVEEPTPKPITSRRKHIDVEPIVKEPIGQEPIVEEPIQELPVEDHKEKVEFDYFNQVEDYKEIVEFDYFNQVEDHKENVEFDYFNQVADALVDEILSELDPSFQKVH